ncbi:MAG: U32 family peptidase [Christensenellaceae bacterium]|nr:U32 family peptidase [Christensenellaceae bacterium]
MMELLAPAGELATAKAAFGAGADACYVGGELSARAYAKNFTRDDLNEIFEYAHKRGKKVYVAVNTMLQEQELEGALSYLGFLNEAGADAVIAADLGLIAAAAECFPALPIHASTQMAVEDAFGARAAMDLGCTRVVPARESTFETLRSIADTGVEVEAFCHGALCSGVSGLCLMSSFIGGRSGNRGQCAQPCRMAYQLLGEKAYHLSTADLCAIGQLEKLQAAGVCSLKIEGRMKRMEYVAVVVDAYRRALDALYGGKAFDEDAARFEMKKIYNRGGFTDGYFAGNRDVTYIKRQNHLGVEIGTLEKKDKGRLRGFVRTEETLRKGDGLEFVGRASHGGLSLAYADKARGGYYVALPEYARVGDKVFRTTDAAQLEQAKAIAGRPLAEHTKTVELDLLLAEGKAAVLQAACSGFTAQAQGEVCPRAQKPLEQAQVEGWLSKTGGSGFTPGRVNIALEGQPFVRASQINALRRLCLEQLAEQLESERPARRAGAPYKAPAEAAPAACHVSAWVSNLEQARAVLAAGADKVIYLPVQWNEETLLPLEQEFGGLWLALPPYWSGADIALAEQWTVRLKSSIAGVVTANIGQVRWAAERGIPFMAGFWHNCANRMTALQLKKLGARRVCASAELDLKHLADLGGLAEDAVIYGRIPLMNLRHCPLKKQGRCGSCDSAVLKDKAGYEFSLRRVGIADCLLQVKNSVTTAFDDLAALSRCGIRGAVLLFGDEPAALAGAVTEKCVSAMESGKNIRWDGIIDEKINTGHFLRGLVK